MRSTHIEHFLENLNLFIKFKLEYFVNVTMKAVHGIIDKKFYVLRPTQLKGVLKKFLSYFFKVKLLKKIF